MDFHRHSASARIKSKSCLNFRAAFYQKSREKQGILTGILTIQAWQHSSTIRLQTCRSCGSLSGMKPSGSSIGTWLVFFCLTVTACSPQAPGGVPAGSGAAEPAHGDILVEGSIGDASNLIPLLASDSTSHEIAGLVFNGLIQYDNDVHIVDELTES